MASDRFAAMELFVRVVDAGSFSAAAAQLHIGQPAVSKTIAQLEERLGVQLLLRSTRGHSLTEAGRNFYDRAKVALENVEHAEDAARSSAGLSGTLRVTASVCFARIHILPNLPEFLAAHPGLELEMHSDDRVVDLVEEGIDLAFRTGALEDSALTARKLGSVPRRVVASAAYFAAHGVPRHPEELIDHQAVVVARGGTVLDSWTFQYVGPNGGYGANGTNGAPVPDVHVRLRGRVKVSTGETLREAVLSDLGLTVVSDWLFTPEIKAELVRAVLPDWRLPGQDLWAVFAGGKRANPKARLFVSFLERCMNESLAEAA